MTALERARAVIGPREMWAIGLVGLREPCPELFGGSAMGSTRVLDDTPAAASAAGLPLESIAMWHDVDALNHVGASPRLTVRLTRTPG